jgi:uncharacterized membrane protein YdjX (TVP38/TMEM64 family)
MGTGYSDQTRSMPKRALVKGFILLAFIIAAVFLFRFTPVKEFFIPENLAYFLETWGLWAPLVFILIHATTICLLFPASILSVVGATIFGTYWGFLYVWIGAIIGGSGSFFLGRVLGRDFVASLIGDTLKKYDDAIERNGFATVLYFRLMNVPFSAFSLGMGMAKVRFWDYFLGTCLGVIAGLFALSFFGGALKEVWVSGNWGELLSSKVFFSVALLIFCFFIPAIIKKIKGEN